MHPKHIAILIVLASGLVALAWDGYVIAAGRPNDTWCQAIRELNRMSDGLVMCVVIGVLIHIFCNQWFPPAWGGN